MIGPFKVGEEIIYDKKEICKLLIQQYNSQFRKETGKKTDDSDLTNIKFNVVDITIAINKVKKNSATGPDGITAIFLINTRDSNTRDSIITNAINKLRIYLAAGPDGILA